MEFGQNRSKISLHVRVKTASPALTPKWHWNETNFRTDFSEVDASKSSLV